MTLHPSSRPSRSSKTSHDSGASCGAYLTFGGYRGSCQGLCTACVSPFRTPEARGLGETRDSSATLRRARDHPRAEDWVGIERDRKRVTHSCFRAAAGTRPPPEPGATVPHPLLWGPGPGPANENLFTETLKEKFL